MNKHTESGEFSATAERWVRDEDIPVDEARWLLGSLRYALPGAEDDPPSQAELSGEDSGPAWWREFLRAVHSSPHAHRKPSTSRRPQPRPRAPRQPRRRQTRTAQDPGDPDGDPDPVEARVRQLVDQAPPFSPGQRALLGRLLGGAL